MPKTNPGRSAYTEQALARRIAYEREQRGWSYQVLAKRMGDAGCPIDQSAVYKIEKHNPPRRITVDEPVAFSTVFGVSVADLLLPANVVAQAAVHDAINRISAAAVEVADAQAHLDDVTQRARAALAELGVDLDTL